MQEEKVVVIILLLFHAYNYLKRCSHAITGKTVLTINLYVFQPVTQKVLTNQHFF